MEQHVRALGVIYVIFGILGVLLGIALLVLLGGIGAASGDREAWWIMGGIGFFVGAIIAILSIPTIVAGIGLQRFRPWARILALILAVLHIFSFPLGTAVGVYAFWVLLNERTQPLFAPVPS
ncbi:MAG: hypothetical protein ACXW3E_14820 [Thermoanaerobaculia bacterium]